MSEQQKDNVEGQSTGNDLPVFDGISPEIVAQLKAEDPAAFQGEKPGPEDVEPAPVESGDGTEEVDGGGGRPGQLGERLGQRGPHGPAGGRRRACAPR